MTEITMMFTLDIIFTIKSVPLIVPRIESLEASTSQKSLQFLLYLRCVGIESCVTEIYTIALSHNSR